MSISFKEFLREQAAKEEASVQANKSVIDDWRSSVDRLYGQIRGWLADSDPSGIIKIEPSEHKVKEEGLGVYRVPRLDLRAFGKWVGIVPKAIHTVGSARPPQKSVPERASGRIDITDEVRRYILYRLRDEAGSDIWIINDNPLRGLADKPLTQQNFEAALMSYFR
jgi:hypothetical protein